jgi:hypothetical protein
MPLIHIIYVSAAQQEFGNDVLDDILQASARNNLPAGITGMLLYSKGTFLQVLEGEREVVEQTYVRIGLDPRHHGVFELTREPIAQREFAGWSMGFRRLTKEDPVRHPAFAPFFENGFNAERLVIQPGVALEVLKQFATA